MERSLRRPGPLLGKGSASCPRENPRNLLHRCVGPGAGPAGLRGLRARSARGACYGSRWLLVPCARLPDSPPAGVEAAVSVTWRSGICIQVTRIKSSSGFPFGYNRRAAVKEWECVAPRCGTVVQSCGEKSGCRGAPRETGSR